jgi:alpha-galactosidase
MSSRYAAGQANFPYEMGHMNNDVTVRQASTPPMGWNSWDCYGTTVTESEVLANALFMADHLLPHGWDTVVVDIQWYEPTARAGGYNDDAPVEVDSYGRPMPALNRFPSAADGVGFSWLAGEVHSLGLQFGLHMMRGIPRHAVAQNLPVKGTGFGAADVADRSSICDWNTDNYGLDHRHPGAQRYYDSLAELFVSWGVDYVKADDMLGPYHAAEIEGLSNAIATCGREIVLSLSPGRVLSLAHAEHLARTANMWRISDDLWDRWVDVFAQFERLARWAPLARPGAWPDADMLPLGRIGIRAERGVDRASLLTPNEQRTMMTLWCIARSPLMLGGDLPTSDPAMFTLLTNDGVLAVVKASDHNRQVIRDEDLIVWTATATDRPGCYVAIFHTGDDAGSYEIPLGSVASESATSARDLWTGLDVAASSNIEVDFVKKLIRARVLPHGCVLLHLS